MNAIADHLWQSTACVGVAALLALGLRHTSAAVRCAIWCAAAAKFLLPWAALIALGRLLPRVGPAPWLPDVPSAEPQLAWAIDIVGHPFSSATVAAAPAASALPMWAVAAGAVWALGAALAVVAVVRRVVVVRRALAGGAVTAEGREWEALRAAQAERASRTPVTLVLSDAPLEPGIVGVWRPVLLWPRALSARLTDAQIDAIVAHELAHVGRRDNLVGWLQAAVQVLFWWHPAVWYVSRRLTAEREQACDEEVVRTQDPVAYAQGILRTCEHQIEARLAFVAGVTGADLRRRIDGIMRAGHVTPLRLWQRVAIAAVAGAALVGPVAAGAAGQAPVSTAATETAPDLEFEVAAVKVNKSGEQRRMIGFQPGGRLNMSNVPLRSMIANAYRLQAFQVVGGPSWIESENFDIVAKAPDGSGTPPQLQGMVRRLLADRFKLRVHTETREMPIYALVLARADGRLGPSLKPTSVDCEAVFAGARGRGGLPPPPRPGEPIQCGMRIGPGTLNGGGLPLAEFSRTLSVVTGRVVTDKTGLTGPHDFELSWTPEAGAGGLFGGPGGGGPPGAPAPDPNGPSIFTAVQEQLGLKLDAQRGPVEVLVVDSAEMPQPD